MKKNVIIYSIIGVLLVAVVSTAAFFLGQRLVSRSNEEGIETLPDAGKGNRGQVDGDADADNSPLEDARADHEWPVYIATMTHLEGGEAWQKAATNESFFSSIAKELRYGMDMAETYGATLTFESEKPFSLGSAAFDDNVLREALDRGHGVGTHCDIAPQVELPLNELVAEFKACKDPVDALVGVENNLGISGGGGKSDWYAGASEAGFSYLDGTVALHYLALPESARPKGWNDKAILREFFHDPAPQDESYFYPFLIGGLGFEEDSGGNLLVTNGCIGDVRHYEETQPLGLDLGTASCGEDCPMTQQDVDLAVEFVRDFVGQHDGSRPGKITFFFPSATFVEENEAMLNSFFSTMQKLENEGLVQWASQREVYDVMMEYYGI